VTGSWWEVTTSDQQVIDAMSGFDATVEVRG
jgi:hypothetical protein